MIVNENLIVENNIAQNECKIYTFAKYDRFGNLISSITTNIYPGEAILDYPYRIFGGKKIIKEVTGIKQRKRQLRKAILRHVKHQIKELTFKNV